MPGYQRPGADPAARVLADVVSTMNGPVNVAGAAAIRFVNRGRWQFPGGVFSVTHLGALNYGDDVTTGFRVLEQPSAASRVVTTLGSDFNVPWGRNLAAGSFDLAAVRPFCRYSMRWLGYCQLRGTADVEMGLTASNGMLSFLGTDIAAVFSSRVAVNGGRWLPRWRRVAAGAILDGVDTGVDNDATPRVFEIRYTEGTTPTLEWLIDGRVVQLLAGLAALPVTPPFASGNQQVTLSVGVNTPAGTTMRYAEFRYLVEALA